MQEGKKLCLLSMSWIGVWIVKYLLFLGKVYWRSCCVFFALLYCWFFSFLFQPHSTFSTVPWLWYVCPHSKASSESSTGRLYYTYLHTYKCSRSQNISFIVHVHTQNSAQLDSHFFFFLNIYICTTAVLLVSKVCDLFISKCESCF